MMGGGSAPAPPPPAPDYGPLARASEEQLRLAKDISDKQLAWAKEQYTDNKGFSDQVRSRLLTTLDKNTAESDQQLARYKALYNPREENFLTEVDNWASPGRMQQGRDRAVANVGLAFDQADAAATRKLEMTGVDPSSVRFAALNRGSKLARAAATAGAANDSDRALDSQALALKANALGMGKGQQATALGFQQAGIGAGMGGVSAGNSTTAGATGSLGNPLGWHQAGTGAIGTWGNVLNAGFQNQMAGYSAYNQAKAQADSQSGGWGQALGTAAGIGGMLLMAADGGSIPGEGEMSYSPVHVHGIDRYPEADNFAEGGAIPNLPMAGNRLPAHMSPSGGEETDDIPAVGPGGSRIQVDAGEFIFPRRTAEWYGEKYLQNMILKADKEMQGAPAKPQMKAISDNDGDEPAMMAADGGAIPNIARMPHMPRRPGALRTVPSFRRRAA